MMCQSMIIFLRKLVKLRISNKRLILLHLLFDSLLSLHLPKLDSSGIFCPAFSISLHWAELPWMVHAASTLHVVRDAAE